MRQFIEQGEKVKVTIMFRGREMVHQDIGRRLLERVAEEAKEIAIVERAPIMEGRNLFMILSPTHKPAPQPAGARNSASNNASGAKEAS